MARGQFENHWCVLRTSGRSTLGLAASLTTAGYEVWTPTRIHTKRAPRTQAKTEHPVPLMPSFVFARAKHVGELLRLAGDRMKDQPDFSVFHYLNEIPLIADRSLEPLRSEETKAIPRVKRIPYVKGDAVRVAEGAYVGMTGIVEHERGKFALVCFGRHEAKIATFILRPNDSYSSTAFGGNAAQAA